jgi:hypothetical protein
VSFRNDQGKCTTYIVLPQFTACDCAEEENVSGCNWVVESVSSCVPYWGTRWLAIAELRSTVHSFVRHGIILARPAFPNTFALLGVHSYLLSLRTFVKWTGDPCWYVLTVSPCTSLSLYPRVNKYPVIQLKVQHYCYDISCTQSQVTNYLAVFFCKNLFAICK